MGDDQMPSGNKSLPAPTLNKVDDIIWNHQAAVNKRFTHLPLVTVICQ